MDKLVFLFLSAFLFLSSISSAAGRSQAVRDTAGEPLRRGSKYYILPVFRGRGGGVSLAARSRRCPLNVAQESSEVAPGLPVTFSPADMAETVIRLATDLNFEFTAKTTCVQSAVWKLGSFDGGARRWYVTAGGIAGNPGVGTVDNWFKIERTGKDYKLVFCPTVCKFCKVLCGDVGIFNEKGRKYLGLNGQAFPVMFKKA